MWQTTPSNESMPSMRGSCGRDRKPTHEMTAFTSNVHGPDGPSARSIHIAESSTQVMDRTSVSNTMCSRMAKWSATHLKYFRFSSRGQ